MKRTRSSAQAGASYRRLPTGCLGIALFTGALACSAVDPSSELIVSANQSSSLAVEVEHQRAQISERILEAISRVPRSRFLSDELSSHAIPGQAPPSDSVQSAQPSLVGLMAEAAGITRGSKVLEIGTGSGYQAAVLAELGARVFSVENGAVLTDKAEERLKLLGYDSVRLRTAEGKRGWPEEAPFDAIIVTTATKSVPAELPAQLASKGRLVILLQQNDAAGENMFVLEKHDRTIRTTDLGPISSLSVTEAKRSRQEEGQSRREFGELERLLQTTERLSEKPVAGSRDS